MRFLSNILCVPVCDKVWPFLLLVCSKDKVWCFIKCVTLQLIVHLLPF